VSPAPLIVLTGGPGGGKSRLTEELQHDAAWSGRVAALPEAIFIMQGMGVSSRERRFQRLMVHLQMSLEEGLQRGLGPAGGRVVLCHRGSLDPLAYWLDRGWPEEEFFAFTKTRREEHLRRYAAVIHLVTAADGAVAHYARWPEAHRPEQAEDAVRLDHRLHRVWRDHPRYCRVGNEGRDWAAKSQAARRILAEVTADLAARTPGFGEGSDARR